MAKLVIRTGRNAGAEFKLNGDRLIMGRRSACPIPIADPKASREHAVVLRKGDDFFLQDLSRNGTLLNGLPAAKGEDGTPLKYGDQIKIGDTVLEMVDEKAEPINIEIPGYQILERIGAGGMGTVFKAKQLSMDRIVALKILNERYSSNSEFVDRFIREARAAGKLNHPNVIHVHDISRAAGRHYFSMEFVDGSSVKEILRVEKKLDARKALDIVLQCARALEFAHENQIVHRDVKPDNIMLSKEGIVKIADLGIAKTFEESAPSAKEHRRVMGTPHYMAPEQALGKTIDHRVDIYSLGATFYHMITGDTPFSGSTAHEILKAHIQESLPAIQELNPGIPDPVCFIIERMMAKLPEKRYPSMSKVIEDIERVQTGITAGIDRIEAGDSTIMRAIQSGKEARAEKADRPPTRGPTDEIATGVQTPLARVGLALVLTAVFAATVAVVVIFTQKVSNGTPDPKRQDPNPPVDTGKTTQVNLNDPSGRSNPEAKKLLAAALTAQQAKDDALYEKSLTEVARKYPASLEAEEANRKLTELAEQRKEVERQRAQAALDDAKTFEAANADKLTECIEKYRQAMATAQNFPAILEPAKARYDELRKRQTDQTVAQLEAVYKMACDTSDAAKGKGDYDAARTALQDFIAQNANAPQKGLAQQALDKLNTEAQTHFKKVQDDASKLDCAPALALWSAYTTGVKDNTTVNDVKAARDAIETKARALADDEMKKASDKAKKFDLKGALDIVHVLQTRLAGIAWVDALKGREDDFKKQKGLYDRVITAIQDGLKDGGNIVLNFEINLTLGKKWKIAGIEAVQPSHMLKLDAVGGGPGLSRRIDQLAPKEQYDLLIQFLPTKLTVDDHKALGAFCRERELAKEAEAHEGKAAGTAQP